MNTFRKRALGAAVLTAVSVASIAIGGVVLGTAAASEPAEPPAPIEAPVTFTFGPANATTFAGGEGTAGAACVLAVHAEAGDLAVDPSGAAFEAVSGERVDMAGFAAGVRVTRDGEPDPTFTVEAKPLSAEEIDAMIESGELKTFAPEDCEVIDLSEAGVDSAR